MSIPNSLSLQLAWQQSPGFVPTPPGFPTLSSVQVSGYSDKTWLRENGTRVTPDQIEQSVDASLQRLKTDHLDLLQIHWPDRYLPLFGSGVYDAKNEREGDVSFEEQLKGLEKVIKDGKVSHI